MDVVGGGLLVLAAGLGMIWANSPWSAAYESLRDARLGYAPWHLDLSVGQWASDGLLTVFFFVVGLELVREFTNGELRHPRIAATPIIAAAGGVAVPALIYLLLAGNDLRAGWAIPTATDIAFAVAVLALVGRWLPGSLRVFLLTLAVVDDLIAIVIIAFVYTDQIRVAPLAISLALVTLFGVLARRFRRLLARRRWAAWALLAPIGVAAWAFMHASGIHATIAGVLLGLCVPAQPIEDEARAATPARSGPSLADQFEHRFSPLSAGLAVPVFALFAAGVAIGGRAGVASALTDPVTLAVTAALVIGKPAGILAATFLATRGRRGLTLNMAWADLLGLGLLSGIGFTVSLLVSQLAFAPGSPALDHSRLAVLGASLVAATAGAIVLALRGRHYRLAPPAREAS
ncbi:Na+/H+ antiporter NhaA [Rarobacter faecitabidus]